MSQILKAMHETATGLYEIGVMDRFTMHQARKLCLASLAPMSPKEIKELRAKCNVSQSAFARYLNVQTTTIRRWEMGTSSPKGAALKLLYLIKEKELEILFF